MNRILTGYQVSFQPELIRFIIFALLVSAQLFLPSLATSGDTGAGYSLFLGSASLQLATKAPVNVSTTQAVIATQHTVQTAVKTTVVTQMPVHTLQGTPVTPLPSLASVPKVTFAPAVKTVKTPDISVVTPRPFATTQHPFVTMTQGALPRFCLSPLTLCQGNCVDTRTNTSNCGYCGQRCNADQHCSGGICVVTCPSGEANLYTDNNNCGACGYQCPADKSCYNKICVANLSPDYHNCGNGYVSFNDDYHCGACFHQCPTGTHCQNGECLLQCGNSLVNGDSDPQNCGSCGHACLPYRMCCNGQCVNWNEIDQNCGSCGHACTDNRTCLWGDTFSECLYHCIGTDGVERYLFHLNGDDNCGGCNIRCTNGTHCASGKCLQNCAEDSVICADTNTCVPRSTQNCAFCGNACRPGESCTNGHCTCPEGYGICDNACVELGTRSHCSGNCQPCPAGYECKKYLQYGTCMMDCPFGYLNCGDGSCKNALVDRANCGACGHTCAAGQFCIAGTCTNSCPAGSQDCGNDGTCDDPLVDPHNCGGCGNACPNAQDVCVNGVCQIACNIPAMYENRCFNETVGGIFCSDKRTDPLNCGGCGRYCNLHETCVDGWCEEACPAGTQYCDGAGCTHLGYDKDNCGYCGSRCGVMCVWGDCWPW